MADYVAGTGNNTKTAAVLKDNSFSTELEDHKDDENNPKSNRHNLVYLKV